MLASTVQFSTTDQPPPHTPANPHPDTTEAVTGDERYEDKEAPEQRQRPTPCGVARSLRTQQRAYGRTPRRPGSDPRTIPPEGGARRHRDGAVLGARGQRAGRTGQRSTLEHHPRNQRPTTTMGRHVLSAALHRQKKLLPARCSLERR